MDRRSFLELGLKLSGVSALPLPALAFQDEKSNLKITGVRIVRTRPRRPTPSYTPAPGSWSTGGVEVANPMSIYPEYKATRSLWNRDPGLRCRVVARVSLRNRIRPPSQLARVGQP
jgi:L-rhamnonate dehydratase